MRSPSPREISPRSPVASPSTSSEAWPMLKTASLTGIRLGSASRALAVRTLWRGTTSRHSRPSGGAKRSAWPSAHRTKPPSSAGATLSGCPSSRIAWASRSAPSSKMLSAATRPATIAAALVPKPPLSGMSERIVNSNVSGGASAANPRTIRLRRSRAIRRSVWTAKLPVSCTSTSMCRSSAAPITSKPGPRLAEEAGTLTVRRLFKDRALDRVQVRLARHDRAGLRKRGLRVLEPMAGEDADDAVGALDAVGQQPGDAGRRRRLAEHALVGREEAVGVEDLVVADGLHLAAARREGLHRLLPSRRVADPDRARDGLRVRDRRAVDQRGRALRLEAEQPRPRAHLLKALVVGGHVACVADRDAERVELAERVQQLEGRGLLAFDAERVDRVDQRDGMALGELAHELERLVEVAAQRDDARPVHQRLGQLAGGDLALGDDHRALQPRPRGVGGERGRRVAGGGADHGLRALAHRVGHRARHPAVLERPGGIGALELEPDLDAGAL